MPISSSFFFFLFFFFGFQYLFVYIGSYHKTPFEETTSWVSREGLEFVDSIVGFSLARTDNPGP